MSEDYRSSLCPTCKGGKGYDYIECWPCYHSKKRPRCTTDDPCTVCFPSETTKPTAHPSRPSWDDYFFSLAKLVSTRSTCPRASIGVVLVSKDRRVISTGFNGSPAGEDHCTDVGCDIFADHCVRATHAEVNAVEGAWALIEPGLGMREDSKDFLADFAPVAYVIGPRSVCSHCARTLRLAGVTEVKWRES